MRYKFRYITMAIAGLLAISCGAINENGDCLPLNDTREINFVLAIDSPEASRAAWEDGESTDELGSSFENRIKPESMRVAVYTASNDHLGDIESLMYWPINDSHTRYQFNGKVPQALMNDMASLEAGVAPNYKFMVYANCANGDNGALEYNFDGLAVEGGAIPMWGVKQVNLSGLQGNKSQNLGEISLLRATAKVEVILDDALLNSTIESVSINHHNRKGYVLPTSWESAADTKLMDREGVFRPYRSLHTNPHNFVEAEAGRKFVFYMPEYDNQLFADYEAKLSVSVVHNGTALSFPDALQFKQYVNGVATGASSNIVRNTIYRFRITKIASGGLELSYEVADWERSDNWEWIQHFDYPNYHNPVLPDTATRDGDSTNDIFPERPEMYYVAPNNAEEITTEQGAFSCWFQMVGPIDQAWTPTLRPASNLCVIRVYKEIDAITKELVFTNETSVTDPSLKNGSKLVAYSGWYNIKVIPINADFTGVVGFGITYTQDWMGAGSRYLLVNGEVDHIIWPNSGNEARLINIQQVAN